ncbi:unnamed protein product (macronuclear) [Paramecium tetraurelia]|uniref:Uncharacterized protein n=1 Tax=Paramecium tetraurelia TaxID=5888 RepID=A0CYY5_PARTE|nr:uncharacterized protein GSPATT00011603001 [Paramecium tetraurelia]CAK76002.1 unnamed protein product [Paramecium tetraurelia]|eukprot:XP_001443399.1 hypothetical protein (macronuclear) [Paramecium tetraurelia strain d4-2]
MILDKQCDIEWFLLRSLIESKKNENQKEKLKEQSDISQKIIESFQKKDDIKEFDSEKKEKLLKIYFKK